MAIRIKECCLSSALVNSDAVLLTSRKKYLQIILNQSLMRRGCSLHQVVEYTARPAYEGIKHTKNAIAKAKNLLADVAKIITNS